MSHDRIVSLTVIGGFLDGTNFQLADGLNCVIGGKGTGKTTMLELIRFALNVESVIASDSAGRRFASLIKENLNGGRVQVVVETKDGLRYTISRTAGEPPIVIGEDGQPSNVSFHEGQFFLADVYSQSEIEAIADASDSQMSLIDRFETDQLANIERQLEPVRAGLEENANAIRAYTKRIASLTNEVAQLPFVEDRLRKFVKGDGGDLTEVNQAHRLKSLRDREARAFESALRTVAQTHAAADKVLASRRTSLLDRELCEGPNQQLIAAADHELNECLASVEELVGQIHERLTIAENELGSRQRQMANRHAQQELEFRNIVEREREAQGQAKERADLERQRNDLLDRQRAKQEEERQLAELRSERGRLIRELSTLQKRRFDIRLSIVERINAALEPMIRVTLTQYGNPAEYRALLEATLKQCNMRHRSVARRLSEAFWPSELSAVIRSENSDMLVESADLNMDQATKVIETLSNERVLLDLECVELLDLPIIELKDGDTYKPSATLSTGQKCTAILPILLMQSESPLLIDQPEDNLDNRFIFETVVRNLRGVKRSRQMLFATHNANLSVLSEAERIFVMQSDGRRARPLAYGTIDDCMDDVVGVLEGGSEPFTLRKERYSYA